MRYGILSLVLVFLLASACGSSNTVSAGTLLEAFQSNDGAATTKYGGRTFTITGEVLKLDFEQGRFVILPAESERGGQLALWCFSSNEAAARDISRLRQYDSVELHGTVVGQEEAGMLRVDDCEVLNIVPGRGPGQ